MDTVGNYDFRVRGYECGPRGTVTLATVCNYLQEAAGLHAGELGFSRSDFLAGGEDISWVLTRLRVKLTRYPRWGETVTVGTYPRSGRRITSYRDFTLRIGEETVGLATSEWVVIDLATRKVATIPETVLAKVNDERAPVMGEEVFSRLRWEGPEPADAVKLVARRGDIDLNGHVNNVHYVEWLLEALPAAAAEPGDFEIVFKSETMAGDEVIAAAVEPVPGRWLAHVASPDGRDHVVARMKAGNT